MMEHSVSLVAWASRPSLARRAKIFSPLRVELGRDAQATDAQATDAQATDAQATDAQATGGSSTLQPA
jgi:hypothetical protein